MARARKGRDISGWLVVDKPAAITSAAVVNKVRWAFNARKVGHAGTLDPDATGVLPVALGEATKTIPYLSDVLKAYDFIVRFGVATETDDAEGQIIARSDNRPTDTQIHAALPHFIGKIQQIPPKFSAIKVAGARAYALARAGQVFDLKPRQIYVNKLTLIARSDADHAILRLVCGSGGYVRAIARDLGQRLGCFAHVQSLRRLWVGPFQSTMAQTFEAIERLAHDPARDTVLWPVALGLSDLQECHITAEGAARIKNGNPGAVIQHDVPDGARVWASFMGHPIAVGILHNGMLHPGRVFNI